MTVEPTHTSVHPVALILILTATVLMVCLDRRFAVIPFIIIAIFIPMSQRIEVATLNFFTFRILIFVGFVRLVIRQEISEFRLNGIDKAIVLYATSGVLAYTLLWRTSEAFITSLGPAYNTIGLYFFFRLLITTPEDIRNIITLLAVVSVIVAMALISELITTENVFSIFGGVPETTVIRAGKIRCQGPFGHPITVGTFGATLMPLFWGLRREATKAKKLTIAAIIASMVIVLASSSSGPLVTLVAVFVGLAAWPLRDHMRVIRWAFLIMLIGLHIVMKAPVWALIGRARILGASSGYHRYFLLDQFIARFGEWALLGTKSTDHWGYYLFDVTNQYVRQGVNGGLITLAVFVMVIVLCFRNIGISIRAVVDPGKQKLLWAFGVSLFGHSVAFFGVSYWDQIMVIWYLLLALISTLTASTNQFRIQEYENN